MRFHGQIRHSSVDRYPAADHRDHADRLRDRPSHAGRPAGRSPAQPGDQAGGHRRQSRRRSALHKPLTSNIPAGWASSLHGDFGISLKTYRPVRTLIAQRVGNTLLLTGSALLFSLLVAIPVGVLSALKRNTIFDYLATICSALGDSIPSFWLGLMLILLLRRPVPVVGAALAAVGRDADPAEWRRLPRSCQASHPARR